MNMRIIKKHTNTHDINYTADNYYDTVDNHEENITNTYVPVLPVRSLCLARILLTPHKPSEF